jgi:hypothetical protein
MVANMPRVININILDFKIRDDSSELLQPIKLMYTKEPRRVAVEQFFIYNAQLPCLENTPADFQDDFYCWLYLMNRAKQKRLTIEEVTAVTPIVGLQPDEELTAFAERNAGFRQYCEQYGRAA